MRTIATAALRAGITSNEMLARCLGCYLEDVPALLREPVSDVDDTAAEQRQAEWYHADAGATDLALAAAADSW